MLAGACSHTMQVPTKVGSTPAFEVERYGGLKEREVKLGGAVVRHVDRSWSRPTGRGLVSFEKAPEESSLGFDMTAQDRAFTGKCVEHLHTNMMGLKNPKVSLECTCREGEATRAQLKLEQYQGAAELAGFGTYQVSALHQDTRGKNRQEVLGYWFQGSTGEGAVDLNADGRIWLPAGVSPEEKPLLLCLYAGLLLYRPGEAL